ncbi:hypothetical protein [Ruegeria sp. Ofav3-42]|uniref:hypothetical protein n=1 Tax=Ruegeria sp. Ofav3-42 TaxID=2917759 RepID=UPI001EF4CCF6|nr:hypothetical protein [Ruegeria sp. Ofav3-42]MCG7522569.1 hypothetical protein [Ruegeria sp. Ofav3-42]
MRFLLTLIFLAEPLAAHPHSKVEQQVILSIGLDRVALSIRIVPLYEEGEEVFAHLDLDGNGTISEAEALSFGGGMISETDFAIDGSKTVFENLSVTTPDSHSVASGEGMIEAKVDARFPELHSAEHGISFSISYEELLHGWFVQPFFFGEVQKAFRKQV